MTNFSSFNLLLSKRMKCMMREQGLTRVDLSHEACLARSTLDRILEGGNASFTKVLSVLYALDAAPSDIEDIYADFAEVQRNASSILQWGVR